MWAQVQYETTSRSCDDIGKDIGETGTSVISRASRLGWTRGKKASAVERSAELVLATKINREEEIRLRYEAVEKVNVAMQAEVLAAHRKDIRSAKKVCLELFSDLNEARADVDPETRMGLMDTSMVMGRLAGALKTLVLLERQAYGIQGAIEDPETPKVQESIPVSALDTVLTKFAKVMELRKETPIIIEAESARPS